MIIWTSEDVKEFTKLPLSTVNLLARRKIIPAKKAGKQWRFVKEKIEEWFLQDQPENPALRIASSAARKRARAS